MKKANAIDPDDLLPEYSREDLGPGVRGKYFEQYQAGTNLVLLEPQVAAAFPSSEAVNAALKSVLSLTEAVNKTKAAFAKGPSRRRRPSPSPHLKAG